MKDNQLNLKNVRTLWEYPELQKYFKLQLNG